MFYLFGDGLTEMSFDTADEAIRFAQSADLESFEVYDADDRLVYQEFPQVNILRF